MRAKLSSLLSDLAQFAEAPHLKSARVRQQGSIPANEFMQSATGPDRFNAGPQPKMIGVTENDGRVEVGSLKFFEANTFDAAGSSDRHEDWCFDRAAARLQHTSARQTVGGDDFETNRWNGCRHFYF